MDSILGLGLETPVGHNCGLNLPGNARIMPNTTNVHLHLHQHITESAAQNVAMNRQRNANMENHRNISERLEEKSFAEDPNAVNFTAPAINSVLNNTLREFEMFTEPEKQTPLITDDGLRSNKSQFNRINIADLILPIKSLNQTKELKVSETRDSISNITKELIVDSINSSYSNTSSAIDKDMMANISTASGNQHPIEDNNNPTNIHASPNASTVKINRISVERPTVVTLVNLSAETQTNSEDLSSIGAGIAPETTVDEEINTDHGDDYMKHSKSYPVYEGIITDEGGGGKTPSNGTKNYDKNRAIGVEGSLEIEVTTPHPNRDRNGTSTSQGEINTNDVTEGSTEVSPLASSGNNCINSQLNIGGILDFNFYSGRDFVNISLGNSSEVRLVYSTCATSFDW